MEVLSGYNKDYRSMIDNLCEVVLGNLIGHMLAGKDLSASDLNQEEYERLQEMVWQEELGALREKLKKSLTKWWKNTMMEISSLPNIWDMRLTIFPLG